MTEDDPASFSALAMYPFEQLRPAWDSLYGAIASRVSGALTTLRWDVDPHDTWLSPGLVLGMTCGWPLVTALRDRVRTIGTFEYELDGTVGHLYRSVIVARDIATIDALANRVAAVNSADSLSGCISLLAAKTTPEKEWPGGVLWTGAHLASLDAVRNGDADIASIDALSWAYQARDDPQRVEGLVVIGRGPAVPMLPLILTGRASDEQLVGWRAAIGAAIADPALKPALDTLLIRGFVPLDLADYDVALSTLG